jgi:GT2 family glycosyltransferase
MKKLFLIIPSNRFEKLHPQTVAVIEKTKTPTIFVKQNLPPYYKNHPYIKEILTNQTGVSKARNKGINIALKLGAKILAFTDDDCVITKNWLKNIHLTFTNPKIDIVFGRTLSYQPQKHPFEYCPCTFSKNDLKPISTPVSTWQHVGMSNNFALSSNLVKKVGLFNIKIGPGTRIPGSEDTDYIIRVIKNRYSIYYSALAQLYHNKWLPLTELQHLYQDYSLSFSYIYMYHALHTNVAYFRILLDEFVQEFFHYFKYLKQITNPPSFIRLISNQNLILYNSLKGCVLSFTYP